MRTVAYFPSRAALYTPAAGTTIFAQGDRPSEDLLCAEFSRLAYKTFESGTHYSDEVKDAVARVDFSEIGFFSVQGSQAFAARNPTTSAVVVAFRGTEMDPTDFATDLDTWPVLWRGGGRAHAGFEHALDLMWKHVEAWLDGHPGRLMMTGHSLGAALATLAASVRKPEKLVTFGSPRVGDGEFAAILETTRVSRYVDCCDVVCRIPPAEFGFSHVGMAQYIDRDGVIRNNLTPEEVSEDQALAREEYLLDYAWKFGNVAVRDLADHAPLNYVSALRA